MNHATSELHDESAVTSVPETTRLQDLKALVKMGIVNSNTLTVFTGFWLALHFNGLSVMDNLDKLFFTIVGSGLVMAGVCCLNNYIDRDIDPLMERTKTRPTVTGKYKPGFALTFGLVILLLGFVFLLLTTPMAVLMGFIGAFTYVVLYSLWTKRKYTLNTVVGSISGAVPPLIGWAAIDPSLGHPIAWMLFLIMFIWQIPHFLALAMKRVDEYRNAGIPMLPVVHGFEITKRQIMIWTVCLLPLPFYMSGLGITFMVIATLLNIGWIVLGFYGFHKKDDIKWSVQMFVYSLNYLTILFVSMIVVTFF
ncbi:protoheme IX farnesyltransferase [Bacillus cereus]|uniref:protoheme IX farnesyltransferase n=1 Tax=Bacillus cereus group TaxID=86661 RepID=UPI0018F31EB0|nr:protoheme IX farnesyltransferase [Bacillus cereus]MBJ7952786.1 protoheme IX farnesyltransferase [Bacillus cereus]MBX9159231.1 protoheme IX farnesyltransferase [Bacillus cereus]